MSGSTFALVSCLARKWGVSSASESIPGAQTKLLAVTEFEIVLSECLSVSIECVRGLREWEETPAWLLSHHLSVSNCLNSVKHCDIALMRWHSYQEVGLKIKWMMEFVYIQVTQLCGLTIDHDGTNLIEVFYWIWQENPVITFRVFVYFMSCACYTVKWSQLPRRAPLESLSKSSRGKETATSSDIFWLSW